MIRDPEKTTRFVGRHQTEDNGCAGNYIDPWRCWQPWKQCHTLTGRNTEGVRRSGSIESRAGSSGRGDASQRQWAVGCHPMRSNRVPAGGGQSGVRQGEERSSMVQADTTRRRVEEESRTCSPQPTNRP